MHKQAAIKGAEGHLAVGKVAFAKVSIMHPAFIQHQFIQGAILQIMALLAPYLGEQQLQFMETCTELSLREKQCQ